MMSGFMVPTTMWDLQHLKNVHVADVIDPFDLQEITTQTPQQGYARAYRIISPVGGKGPVFVVCAPMWGWAMSTDPSLALDYILKCHKAHGLGAVIKRVGSTGGKRHRDEPLRCLVCESEDPTCKPEGWPVCDRCSAEHGELARRMLATMAQRKPKTSQPADDSACPF